VEKAGETCDINIECISFTCVGVVDPNNNPQVVADTTYTFHPCDDPITFSTFSTVSSFEGLVFDVRRINQSAVIQLNPSFLGSVGLTFNQTEDGVRFGVSALLEGCVNAQDLLWKI
jgi:hypothetical protein